MVLALRACCSPSFPSAAEAKHAGALLSPRSPQGFLSHLSRAVAARGGGVQRASLSPADGGGATALACRAGKGFPQGLRPDSGDLSLPVLPNPQMRSEVPGGTPARLSPPGWLLRRLLARVALAALMDVFAGRASHPSGVMLCVFPVHRNVKYQSSTINTA